MLSLNGSAELTRLKSAQRPQQQQQQRPPREQQPQAGAGGSAAADRVLRAAQRAVDSAVGDGGGGGASGGAARPPESEEALRQRWAAAWQVDEDAEAAAGASRPSEQPPTAGAAAAGDVRASQASTTLDDEFFLVPDSAAAQLAASPAAGQLRTSGRLPDKLLWKQPAAVVSDVVDVRANDATAETMTTEPPEDDEGIATMTLRGAATAGALRQGAPCESPPERLVEHGRGDEDGEDEELEAEQLGGGDDEAARRLEHRSGAGAGGSSGSLAACRRLLASRKVGGGVSNGVGAGGRVVHPRLLPTAQQHQQHQQQNQQQQQQQLTATAAASAAVAMAEPLLRGQQQVESQISRLLERLERLEAGRGGGDAGGAGQQRDERRLREQLDRLLGERLGQLERLQREQLRVQQEMAMQQQHRVQPLPMPLPLLPPPPPPPPPPDQQQQQFLRRLVDAPPPPPPVVPQEEPSVARAARVVADIRDEVRDIARRGDGELGGGVARLLSEIDSIRSDIRAHKDRYQATASGSEAAAAAQSSRPTTSMQPPQHQSSPALSAIERVPGATPAVSLSGLSRFEINGEQPGAGAVDSNCGNKQKKKRRSYPLNEYLRRDPLPDRSAYPSFDSVLPEGRQQQPQPQGGAEDPVSAARRTLREVRRQQKALEARAQAAERSRDGKLIYSIIDAAWREGEAAQKARVRAVVDEVVKNGGRLAAPPGQRPPAGGFQQRRGGASSAAAAQPPPGQLPIRAIFEAGSDAELARLCAQQPQAPPPPRQKLGPWQRMPYMHFANDVKGPITAFPPADDRPAPRRRSPPARARDTSQRAAGRPPPRTREEAVQAEPPPPEDAASVEGAGVRLPGYREPRPPPSARDRPGPRRRPSVEDAAAASQPSGRRRHDEVADALRSRMRDEVLAEVLARMAERRPPTVAPAEPANSAGLEALIRRMILSGLLARIERALRRRAGRDVRPQEGSCSTPELTPPQDELPSEESAPTPTPRPPPPRSPRSPAEPSVPLSALQLLLEQRREPQQPPPPPPPQPQPRAASPEEEPLSTGTEPRRPAADDTASLPSRHSVPTPTPSLEEPPSPPAPQPRSRADFACQTLRDTAAQTAVDVEAQTTPRRPEVAEEPPAPSTVEVPPSVTPSPPSSPASPTFAESISEGAWLLDRSEGQGPNLLVASEARQLLGQLDSNGDSAAALDLTGDLSLADASGQQQPRSEGEFLHRPSHRPDPARDPVLAVIARSDGRPLYPRAPGPAAADAGSSAGSSLSEQPHDFVTSDVAEDDDESDAVAAAGVVVVAAASAQLPAGAAASSSMLMMKASQDTRPSQSLPAQRESLGLTPAAAAAAGATASSSSGGEFRTETFGHVAAAAAPEEPLDEATTTERPDIDPEAYLDDAGGLTSTASRLLSTGQAIQDAFAATADSASLATTGPRRLTVNVPGLLDPVAGSSPDDDDDEAAAAADSVSEISMGQ